eukprot:Em0013g3a
MICYVGNHTLCQPQCFKWPLNLLLPAHREAGEEGTEGKPIIVVVKQKQLPHVSREVPHLHKTGARNLSIRGTPLMRGDCFQQLLPLLLVSHLAVFGVGWYLGRRTGFIRA